MSLVPFAASLAASTASRRLPSEDVTMPAPIALPPLGDLSTAAAIGLAAGALLAPVVVALGVVEVCALVCGVVAPVDVCFPPPPPSSRTIASTIASAAAPPIRIAPPRRDGRGPVGPPAPRSGGAAAAGAAMAAPACAALPLADAAVGAADVGTS